MMTGKPGTVQQAKSRKTDAGPRLNIGRLGIVSRDYGHRYGNGYRDFSHVLPKVLGLMDDRGCDSVLFSLFTIVPRASYDTLLAIKGFRNIKAVFLEEFKDEKYFNGAKKDREQVRYVVYHLTQRGWREYELRQAFGRLTEKPKPSVSDFVKNEIPKRILGNCCVLLCGETNGVTYSAKVKEVDDKFSLRAHIPQEASIILNPVHDRMIRFEMKRKRKYLSENGRWVVSVWNKGKKDKNGAVRDGKNRQ
jgi:hypothetical protein